MADRIQAWLAAQIEERAPDKAGTSSLARNAAVQDLLRAQLFFAGKNALIFGMSASPSTIAGAAELGDACRSMLRRWYEAGDDAIQTAIYEASARGLELGVPAPRGVVERTRREAAVAAALASLPSPRAALARTWPSGVPAVRALLALAEAPKPPRFGKPFTPNRSLDASAFEWTRDDWRDVAELGCDPAFFPFAGADGDHLGLYLDTDLLSAGAGAPVLFHFHENDPPFSWVCEGAEQACAMLEARRGARAADRGRRHAKVEDLLAALAAPTGNGGARGISAAFLWSQEPPDLEHARAVYERAGNSFAATFVEALRVLRAIEPSSQPDGGT